MKFKAPSWSTNSMGYVNRADFTVFSSPESKVYILGYGQSGGVSPNWAFAFGQYGARPALYQERTP